ncbi:strictosidine synthase [Saccharothrix sp. ALI-22-I]|uniref:SMP-30/gluconolactonase/LRE family protein n=1 Tax=Saccharothrix sp. ALI-22-I TaxID=1933778 RepID=UPI00097CB1F8|nr:SMP-30/gluconolactonase/LRE family protein [Saccharothrix sp. ALI-22-I]ONI87692.1 strictosidine synthase [Saccharothrix sp. ALI-22-I]
MPLNRRLISPRRWTPPADQGRTPATSRFVVDRRIPTGGHGPEHVIFDSQGGLLAGLADGTVVRIAPATGARTVVGSTGGRPLGLQPAADGSILICDHHRGLLRMSAAGSVEVLVDTVAGRPLTFASNVVEGPDGTIWFTVSTRRWDLEHYLGDIIEHSCTGLLVRRDPDGTVTVLRDGLKFANGLVLAPDASHLLVAETAGYRISRHWLTGPKAGTDEPFVDNLAGLPDNMSLGGDGLVWVAIAAPRNALLDKLLPLPGFLRVLLWNLPEAVRPKATPVAWVMAFDLDGRVVHDLRADDVPYGFVTSVAEHEGTVVAGSLHEDDIVVLTQPTGLDT